MRTATVAACSSALILMASAVVADAATLQGVTLESGTSGTRAEVLVDAQGPYKVMALSAPDRLVVDFPESSTVRQMPLPGPAGVIKSVRTGTPMPGTVRIVFELTHPVQALPAQWMVGARPALVLQWPGAAGNPAPVSTASAAPATAAVPAPVSVAAPDPAEAARLAREEAARATALLSAGVVAGAKAPAPAAPVVASPSPSSVSAQGSDGKLSPESILQGAHVSLPPPPPATGATEATVAAVKPQPAPVVATPAPRKQGTVAMSPSMRRLVVAIDAGHGGQDPGAVGPTGKREKDVTLAVARELARQVDATPGLKAFLVRDSDVFIPLPARTARARQAKADIFISIHADAAENRNARGSSVYVLSTKGASSQRARWLADKENAADLIGGVALRQAEGTLANVLVDLAQTGQQKASEVAADQVLAGLKRIGNNHKPNIERANFAVLRTSDMPAMLVETAFISNPDEEVRLFQPAFQRQLAAAVLDGVHTYFSRQPPPGTLFAARAEAESAKGNIGRGSP